MSNFNNIHSAFTTQPTTLLDPRNKINSLLSSRRPRFLIHTTISTTRIFPRCIALDPNKTLSSQQLEEWSQVSSLVTSIDSSIEKIQADKLVSRAFGWGTQKFWRGDVKHEPPSLEQAKTSIDFLRNRLELDDSAIAAILKKLPEVLRLPLSRMTANIDLIQSNYPSLKDALLQNSVKANPSVLGYDFDCEGDCQSECARCWVQF